MKALQILTDKKLNITTSRKSILNVLLQSEVALSEKEIRSTIGNYCDRATIYRTLKIFNRKGIVHPVITERSITKYVIRKKPDNHLHFKCTSCDQVFCMTGIELSAYTLPKGFIQKNTNFLITGICKVCNQ